MNVVSLSLSVCPWYCREVCWVPWSPTAKGPRSTGRPLVNPVIPASLSAHPHCIVKFSVPITQTNYPVADALDPPPAVA